VEDRPARTPLDEWIAGKIGVGRKASPFLSRDDLDRYHLEKLRGAVDYAKLNSPFYARLLTGFCGRDLTSLESVASLPFTTAQDIKDSPLSFLCVSQDEIARVVTLTTSGTTGASKRFFFTAEDLELTIDSSITACPPSYPPGSGCSYSSRGKKGQRGRPSEKRACQDGCGGDRSRPVRDVE
jgi:hypothetical protein